MIFPSIPLTDSCVARRVIDLRFVVTPDRVQVGGSNFFKKRVLQKALAHIADGTAFELGRDRKHHSVVAPAGRGKGDGLGVSQLDLGYRRLRIGARQSRPFYETTPASRRACPGRGAVTRRVHLP